MSQAGSEDFKHAPLSPSVDSETGSMQSLMVGTILKLIAKLRGRDFPYPTAARKAELFRLLFPPPVAAGSKHPAGVPAIHLQGPFPS